MNPGIRFKTSLMAYLAIFMMLPVTSFASECFYRLSGPSRGKYWVETPPLGGPVARLFSPVLEPLLSVPRLKRNVEIASLNSEAKPHTFFTEMLRDFDITYNKHPHVALGKNSVAIPKEGPVVVVANHPLGFADALVLADFIASQRTDYKILGNALLKHSVPKPVSEHLIAVDLWSESDRREEQRRIIEESRQQLLSGGVLGIFPSGAASLPEESELGQVVLDKEWKSGVSRMIAEMDNVTVVPLFFAGVNTDFFYGASDLFGDFSMRMAEVRAILSQSSLPSSKKKKIRENARAFVRQALFAREYVQRWGQNLNVVVGEGISSAELNAISTGQPYSSEHRKAIAEYLRQQTYQLSHSLPVAGENALLLQQLFPLQN